MLPVNAAIELINKMQQTATALQQAGLVKPNPPKAEGKPAIVLIAACRRTHS